MISKHQYQDLVAKIVCAIAPQTHTLNPKIVWINEIIGDAEVLAERILKLEVPDSIRKSKKVVKNEKS